MLKQEILNQVQDDERGLFALQMLIFATAGLQPTRPDPVAGQARNDSSGDWGSGSKDCLQAMPRKKEEVKKPNPAGRSFHPAK